ncbi:hypothetical protein ABT56_16025 [Photobacterium aquae]|uniref:Chemotaxis protein n=1 Tax=Photobacterium aquae TaxID=1195763 RepID=A0A0J1GWP7_9GAMM|nr:methyl-accepting chemotaxis protein [Photobacterium aquae]KLV04115.1 hypothetical protein ABT56_16025 [Photobacterium aquae]
MRFNNLSVGKKIGVGFAIVFFSVVAMGIFLVSEVTKLKESILVFTDATLPSIVLVKDMQLDSEHIRRQQFFLVSNVNNSNIDQSLNDYAEQLGDMAKKVKEYQDSVWEEEDRRFSSAVTKAWQNYSSDQSEFITAIKNKNITKANAMVVNSLDSFNSLIKSLDSLLELNQSYVHSDRKLVLEQVYQTYMLTIGGIVAIMLFTIFITTRITRQICIPLNKAKDMAERIAMGDLTSELDRSLLGRDELGQLSLACIGMQDKLRDLLHEISSAATQLGAAIEEVSAVSEQTSQGMKQQQDDIITIATAMNQMQATVNDVAANTEEASNSASAVTDSAVQGGNNIRQNIDSIQTVAKVVADTESIVTLLEKDSASIGMVVDVINSIAEQTNLLALNAAIEAARAGEQGRGFAVVADEVRTLAGRTQASTTEITSIIEQLQARAVKAGDATRHSSQLINDCVCQSEETGKNITEIEEEVRQMASMNIQIASACSEQNSVTEDLGRNVENISLASSQIASGADQTAQACVELSQLATNLQDNVGRFRLV